MSDLGGAFFCFKPCSNVWTRAIALSLQMNFGVPKCRRSAVGAGRVPQDQKLKEFLAVLIKDRVISSRVYNGPASRLRRTAA
jgi:hypothetical protein